MSVQVAKRYAKALFELAVETNQLEAINTELLNFVALLERDAQVSRQFFSPEIEKKNKQIFLDEQLGKMPRTFLNFLKLVVDKGREPLLPQMVKEFGNFYDHKLNRVKVKVVSAVALDEPTMARLKKVLAEALHANVLLQTAENRDILGGLIVEVDGKIIDGSLRRKFKELKTTLEAH